MRRGRIVPVLKKKKKDNKKGTATIQLKDHADNPPTIGHDVRLQAYVKRCVELKMLDYTHREIAQMMFIEFKMERVPSIGTIANWLDIHYRTTDEDMKRIHFQFRFDQYNLLDVLKNKWMAIAKADHLKIQRWVQTKKGLQPTIDENAIGEQLKATEVVVKIMARQARLFGLDLEQAGLAGHSADDIQGLQVWIIQQINNMAGTIPAGGPIIEEGGFTLELKSGIEEL